MIKHNFIVKLQPPPQKKTYLKIRAPFTLQFVLTMIKSFSDRYTCRFNFAWCLRCINQFKFYSSRAPSLFTDRYDATVTLHIILIPTPTLKLNCIRAIVTGLTLLMSRNKSLVLLDVSCFSAAPSDPTLLSGSCSQDLH